MVHKLFVLLFTCCLSLISCKHESCRAYFTHQPPVALPCNPYLLRNTTVTLQCKVSAPIRETNPQELNVTTIWMKLSTVPGATEEIIYDSEFADSNIEISTHKSSREYQGPGYAIVSSVTSSLSLHFNQESDFAGKYWCRVMLKDLDNYSYMHEGDSIVTQIKNMSYYVSNDFFYPPCMEKAAFHHAELKCVGKNLPTGIPTNASTSKSQDPGSNSVIISRGGLAALAISGGFLTVLLLIASLMAAYSCAVISRRRMNVPVKGINGRSANFRPSMQSNETLEEDIAIGHSAYSYKLGNLQPLGIRTSSFGSQGSGNMHRKYVGSKSDTHMNI